MPSLFPQILFQLSACLCNATVQYLLRFFPFLRRIIFGMRNTKGKMREQMFAALGISTLHEIAEKVGHWRKPDREVQRDMSVADEERFQRKQIRHPLTISHIRFGIRAVIGIQISFVVPKRIAKWRNIEAERAVTPIAGSAAIQADLAKLAGCRKFYACRNLAAIFDVLMTTIRDYTSFRMAPRGGKVRR